MSRLAGRLGGFVRGIGRLAHLWPVLVAARRCARLYCRCRRELAADAGIRIPRRFPATLRVLDWKAAKDYLMKAKEPSCRTDPLRAVRVRLLDKLLDSWPSGTRAVNPLWTRPATRLEAACIASAVHDVFGEPADDVPVRALARRGSCADVLIDAMILAGYAPNEPADAPLLSAADALNLLVPIWSAAYAHGAADHVSADDLRRLVVEKRRDVVAVLTPSAGPGMPQGICLLMSFVLLDTRLLMIRSIYAEGLSESDAAKAEQIMDRHLAIPQTAGRG